MTRMRRLRIWWLKRKLSRQVAEYDNTLVGDGGHHISDIIRPGERQRLRDDINETIFVLKGLDPDADILPYL